MTVIFKWLKRKRREDEPTPQPPKREDNTSMAHLVRLLQEELKEPAE
jgi:hypothetical protein